LITRYGIEKTRYLIEFAADKARETNFKIQHFGAVLSYASRALADYSRQRSQAEPRTVEQLFREPEQPDAEWKRGEQRLAVLIMQFIWFSNTAL
jgi:hypothetical protein